MNFASIQNALPNVSMVDQRSLLEIPEGRSVHNVYEEELFSFQQLKVSEVSDSVDESDESDELEESEESDELEESQDSEVPEEDEESVESEEPEELEELEESEEPEEPDESEEFEEFEESDESKGSGISSSLNTTCEYVGTQLLEGAEGTDKAEAAGGSGLSDPS